MDRKGHRHYLVCLLRGCLAWENPMPLFTVTYAYIHQLKAKHCSYSMKEAVSLMNAGSSKLRAEKDTDSC